jgi:hypothetical protein
VQGKETWLVVGQRAEQAAKTASELAMKESKAVAMMIQRELGPELERRVEMMERRPEFRFYDTNRCTRYSKIDIFDVGHVRDYIRDLFKAAKKEK